MQEEIKKKEYISHNLEETKTVAQELLNILESKQKKDVAIVVALYGDLGAGKTALVKCVAQSMGITETVTSPTFVIMKKYTPRLEDSPLPSRGDIIRELIHIDAYRLEKASELETLDFKNTLKDPQNIIFIEWPEHVKDLLPTDTISIQCEFIDESTRKYTFLVS